ncbi:MAG: hypothetical protein JWL69_100 [Phycisphaerales bacterium]|nr:hypothetical protein [Phycisphaerales bacterium]
MLTGRNHGVLRLLPVIIVALAAIHLYRPPSRAAELEVSPDSVEYAVAARRLATTGRYEIRVNGRPLPPRYPPGFSAIFLAPVYALAPGNIGNGIFAVWAAACGAALLVYLIGSKLAGPWGGVFAAVIFLHHAEMMKYTQLVMTDIPAVLLGLTACLVYLRIRSRPTTAAYFGGGVICALSIAIRPLTGILAIPFVFEILRTRRHGWVRDLAAIALPCAAVVLLNGLYQQHAFGDWRRTGYQFWLPVPYDYFSLTFSPRYLGQNFARFNDYLVWAPLAMGTLGAIALCRRRSPHLLPVVAFTVLGALPLSVVHLFYFFTDIRFHFLGLTLVCLLAGCGAAVLIPEALRRQLWFMLPLACLTILVPRLPSFPLDDQPPMRFAVATTAARLLPGNAVLISGIDPPYLEELFVRGTARKVLPISRDTPYAAAVLARHRIAQLDPPPHNAADHACPGLVAGGAERLYPFTAEQGVTQLSQWIDAGVPVYAELLSTGPDQPGRRALSAAFRFTPASQDYPWLVRLEPIAPLPGK